MGPPEQLLGLLAQKITSRKLPGHAYLRYACFGGSMHPDRTVSGRSTSPTSPFLRAANAPPGPPRPTSRFKWDMGLRGVPVSRFLLHPDVLQSMPVRCASLQSVCRYVSNVIGAGDAAIPRSSIDWWTTQVSDTSAVSRYALFRVPVHVLHCRSF